MNNKPTGRERIKEILWILVNDDVCIGTALTRIDQIIEGCMGKDESWLAATDYEDDMAIHKKMGSNARARNFWKNFKGNDQTNAE